MKLTDELALYADAVFEPGDVVEVRMIRTDVPPESRWVTAAELAEQAESLAGANAGGWNIYAGANARTTRGARGDVGVACARTIFADFDSVGVDEVAARLDSVGLPAPTLTLASGHGIHCYWRLANPMTDLSAWTELQKDLITAVGADPVIHNPERIMRAPGFANHKKGDGVEAHIIEAAPARTYPLEGLRLIIPRRVTPQPPPAAPRASSSGHGKHHFAPTGEHWLKRYLAEAATDGRNECGKRLAMQLRDDDIPQGTAAEIMRQYVRRCPEKDHAYDEAEAMRTLASVYRRGKREPARSLTPRRPTTTTSRVEGAAAGSGGNMGTTVPIASDDEPAGIAKLKTDIGLAARFVDRHGHSVRYCHEAKRWYVFTGKRWAMDDVGRVNRWAQQTALAIYREAADEEDEGRRKHLIAFATAAQKRDRINAMLDLAKCRVAITAAELDADPMLLNCGNGTVDLRTGELYAHRREDYLTKLCNADYRPGTPVPVFHAFLARIFRTHPALVRYIQKAIGYAATGQIGEQVLFFLYGTGANGKTTLLDAAMHALGAYADKADRDLLTAQDRSSHPTNIADLWGRRLVVCSETNEGGRFDEAKLKDIVGETTLKGRFMKCDFFTFPVTHKVFLYSNHKPIVRGTDTGFWRRMRLIPFVETIGDEEKDSALPAKLRAEADGILAWIVEGALLWQREGLGLPDEVAEASNVYRVDMDSIGTFLGECCLIGDRMTATARDLYQSYSAWCEDGGEHPLSQKRLGMSLKERGLKDSRGPAGRKMWHGIGLKATPKPAEGGA